MSLINRQTKPMEDRDYLDHGISEGNEIGMGREYKH